MDWVVTGRDRTNQVLPEITIIGSFSETFMFPATVDYLDSGKVKTQGIVNKTFKLEQWGEALESIRNKSAIKAAIVFD